MKNGKPQEREQELIAQFSRSRREEKASNEPLSLFTLRWPSKRPNTTQRTHLCTHTLAVTWALEPSDWPFDYHSFGQIRGALWKPLTEEAFCTHHPHSKLKRALTNSNRMFLNKEGSTRMETSDSFWQDQSFFEDLRETFRENEWWAGLALHAWARAGWSLEDFSYTLKSFCHQIWAMTQWIQLKIAWKSLIEDQLRRSSLVIITNN